MKMPSITKETKTPKKISLCMITRNEAAHLKKSLNSVANLVDETIIVDTGSVDDTKRIALEAGAKVFDYHWIDDFSSARNHALTHANGDWILVLDADETISVIDHKRIRSAIEENNVDAYTLIQRTYGRNLNHADYVSGINDKYSESRNQAGWIPSKLVRLFRNNKGYHFKYRIHEVIEPSIEQLHGIIEDSGIPIHHFTYKKDPAFIQQKIERYMQIGLEQIKETPNDPKPYREVALIYLEANKFREAEAILLQAIEAASPDPYILDSLATLYLATQRPALAETTLRKGLSLKPNDVMMLNKLASAHLALGNTKEAESILNHALSISPQNPKTNNNRGLLYAVTNRLDEAATALKRTLVADPENLYALTHLGMLYANMGRYADAQAPLQRAHKIAHNDVKVLYHLGITLAALGNRKKGIKYLQEAHDIQPGDPAINTRLHELSKGR